MKLMLHTELSKWRETNSFGCLINILHRPEVKFFCDVTYDPFKFMEANNKLYGKSI